MSNYEHMTTDELAYYRSEIVAQIKRLLFVPLSEAEKKQIARFEVA